MAEHFEDFWVCGEGQTADRATCVAEIRAQFDEMTSNPTHTQVWSGHDNSFKAWESRLSTRLTPLFVGETRPVLMVHGEQDLSGAPVQSARRLVQDLQAAGQGMITYWEIDGMGHDIWSLPPEDALALEERILDWLLNASPSSPASSGNSQTGRRVLPI